MSLQAQAAPRSDGQSKVDGSAIYGIDYSEVGMLYGALLRSPLPAARIVALDVSGAAQLDGVHSVLTHADAPDALAGWVLQDQRLLAVDEVHYEGHPIAVVVADTLEIAREATRRIHVEFEELEAVVDLKHAATDESRVIHADWESFVPTAGDDYPRHRNVAVELLYDADGVDEAFESAHKVVEDEFVANRQYQGYIEPKSAAAHFRDGRYTVHTASQYPFNVRDRIAQFLAVRPSDVRVIGHSIGGAFGAKLDAALEQFAAFAAGFTSGRAVKFVNTREEDMLVCPSREGAVTRIRSAIDEDGNVLAREFDVIADNGAHSGEMPWLASIPLHLAHGVYKCGPTRVRSRLVYTNTTPTGAFRGVNGNYLYHAIERHTDNLAREAGVDRREYRLRHLFEDGHKLLNEQQLDDASILRQGFDEVEAIAPWSTSAESSNGVLRGRGIAAAWWLTNPLPGSVMLKLNEDGTVTATTGANDNGSGAVSIGVTQIIAEEMGLPPTDVHVTMPDTDTAGYDAGSQGSRTTHVVGRAAVTAATEVKKKIADVAAALLEAAAEDIEIADGRVGVRGSPATSLGMSEVALAATFSTGPIAGTGSYMTPMPDFNPSCASGLLFPAFTTPTYHVHQADVEVDPVTGEVRVTRYVVAQEVGKSINDAGVYGQVTGGVAQGIGYALYESLRVGDDGRYVERTLENYRLPLAVDIPPVEFVAMEHPDPAGPYGAKGVAEAPVLLGAAVIANAVSEAIGRPFDTIPITPDAVLEALEATRS